MSPRRKQVIVRELRDLVFRACSAGGGFLGLVYALHHWNSRPADCKGGADALAGCASHTLTSGVTAFLVPVFIGVIAGALVGALLASRIRSRRSTGASRRSRGSFAPAPLVVADDQKMVSGRWLVARYAGRCDGCRATITPGDRIRHSPGRNVCERCGTAPVGEYG
jgi:hypothetical protein